MVQKYIWTSSGNTSTGTSSFVSILQYCAEIIEGQIWQSTFNNLKSYSWISRNPNPITEFYWYHSNKFTKTPKFKCTHAILGCNFNVIIFQKPRWKNIKRMGSRSLIWSTFILTIDFNWFQLLLQTLNLSNTKTNLIKPKQTFIASLSNQFSCKVCNDDHSLIQW